jgi:PAS domain S-box-containing protein
MATSLEREIRGSSEKRLLWVGGGLFAALYLAWLLWGRVDGSERLWLGGLASAGSMLAAAVLAAQRAQDARQDQRGWRGLAGCLWLWAAAAGLRVLIQALPAQQTVLQTSAQLIFAAGGVVLTVGLSSFQRPAALVQGRIRLVFDVVITCAALGVLTYLSFLRPWLTGGLIPRLPVGYGAELIFYSVCDLAFALALLVLFVLGRADQALTRYAWLLGGLLAFLLSDNAFALAMRAGEYIFGTPNDFGWVIGSLCLCASLVSSPQDAPDLALWSNPRARRWLVSVKNLVPIVAVVILGWYVAVDWRATQFIDPLGLWTVFLLALALIARQGILAGEEEFSQYASLVYSVAEPAFVCSEEGLFSLVNPAMLQAAGYDQESDLLNRSLGQVLPASAQAGSLVRQGLASAQGWSGETELVNRGGAHIPIFLSLRPVLPANSARLALAGTAHDLSLQKSQQAALQRAYTQIAADSAELARLNAGLEQRVAEKTADLVQAYEQLEEQNKALLQLDQVKSDFVSLVSHELRAPLTNINSGMELLNLGPHPHNERSGQIIHLVQAEVRRLTRFVETILDLSALDAGRLPLYPEPLSLDAAARQVAEQIRHLPGAERVQWNLPADLPPVAADAQALTSILFHLLDNAFKYAPQGPIHVFAGSDDRQGWLQVCDCGPGIPEDSLPYLFERFYRSNSRDNQTVYGHGLGLYIVRRLAEAMDGSVSAQNLPQGGACFTCRLPLAGGN